MMTVLHKAAKRGDIQAVKLILIEQHGVDYINLGDMTGTTALHYAIRAESLEVTELLLIHGANPNIQNLYGHTASHYAVNVKKRIEFIKLLLAHGANPNIQDKYCSTPLHCAAHYCDIVTIKLLLKKGANLNVLDVTHSTPFADAYRMFMVDQETNKGVMQLLVTEIVKLEHLGIKISGSDLEGVNLNKQLINESKQLKELEQQCHKEIKKMKSICVSKNDSSFFDIFVLQKDINTLARCANNSDIVKYQNKFSMYSSFIEKSIKEGKARAKMLQGAVESIDEIFESNQDANQESQISWLHLPPEVRMMILENLSNTDLTKLQHNDTAEAEAEAELEGAYAIYEGE
ncbi:ankyrin repeat-containing protein 05_03 [Orientia tsutsugamushi str. Ikeda]|uniref:Ankyrin repeat-containing protein 05_01 n=1 Tax=Orientia tsutsugamushi (strain Ikeda) TaxID=334380 RepID=B3CQW3_ORITI|nr:ankyrin repeat domain-containing protein [Orientia tsutsugamushi]BAG39672.1 ankyrin repeat-containing protein 05_01 [Orientia tsutsugamushi str. Ikeda]BAG39870.1 ankyrin repeat-containing protein 05_02 [Orientia tsutsugamushi str. Ikeda]BAG39945.1 ankyrin repeat-containing protein 05_03 [Orientia tsutsugamushi str. Ikeda]